MSVSKEAWKPSELATTLTFHPEFDDPVDLARWIDEKLSAALPFLTRPAPSQSDEALREALTNVRKNVPRGSEASVIIDATLSASPAPDPAEAMRAALEPFAEAAKGIPDSSHDTAPACRISHDALCPGTFTTINNAAFRRAAAALSALPSRAARATLDKWADTLEAGRWAASPAPDPAKSVGSVTHIPSSPLIVDDAPDPAEAMRAKTITVQGMFGPPSSHTLECPYPKTAKNCTCGGIDAALKGKWR